MKLRLLRKTWDRRFLFNVVFSASILVTISGAQETTYSYTGNAYQVANFVSPTVCPLMFAFTTTEPIPPNSVVTTIPTSFSFTNCFNTITNHDAFYDASFEVATDSQGRIYSWGIYMDEAVNVSVKSKNGSTYSAIALQLVTNYSIEGGGGGADGISYYVDAMGDYIADWNTNSPGVWAAGGSCGDERDQLINEYTQYDVSLHPQCSWFTKSARSVNFTFKQINGGDYSWALIRSPLVAPANNLYGLDAFVVAYGGARKISSGYLNPARNAKVGGKPNSRHVYGDAADFKNISGSQAEWDAMVAAAMVANADGIGEKTFIDPMCKIACVHGDWRHHRGKYVPSKVAGEQYVPSKVVGDQDVLLHQMLTSATWQERSRAFYSVATMDNVASVDVTGALITLLAKENTIAHRHRVLDEAYFEYYLDVIGIVASLESPRSVDVLLGCMTTGRMATLGLARLGEIALDPSLARMENPDIHVRQSATIVLSEMLAAKDDKKLNNGRFEAVKRALFKAVSDKYPYIRMSAMDGLVKIGGPEVSALLQQLATTDPYEASIHGGDKGVYPVRDMARSLLLGTQ